MEGAFWDLLLFLGVGESETAKFSQGYINFTTYFDKLKWVTGSAQLNSHCKNYKKCRFWQENQPIEYWWSTTVVTQSIWVRTVQRNACTEENQITLVVYARPKLLPYVSQFSYWPSCWLRVFCGEFLIPFLGIGGVFIIFYYYYYFLGKNVKLII